MQSVIKNMIIEKFGAVEDLEDVSCNLSVMTRKIVNAGKKADVRNR